MLKGNNFLHDDDNDRSERFVLLSGNIDAHAVSIGVGGTLLTWAQGASAAWENLRENALVQDGEMDEAYQHLQEKHAEAAELYAEAKGLLLAIIDRVQKDDDIRNRYGVEGEAPRTFGDLHESIGQWKKTHDVLVVALDERVVSDTIVNNMVTLANDMYDFMQAAITEKDEKSDAFLAKQTVFSVDTDNLRLVYRLARMTWGKDDSNLRLLGFVPSSEVWTPGDPEPEEPEEPEAPEGVPFPGPMGLFKVSVVVGLSLTVEVILTKIIGCPRCVLEREQDGSGVWEYITEYNLDADEILPFRDRVPFPGIFHYRATPYNELGEPGISSEDTVEVT
ncbi:hypothetical protein KAH81_09975 [bacterium]|nr:hypothetical protein [bacterium]